VIDAYGAGLIELDQPKNDGHGAGAVFPAGKTGRLYNLATVARFLGWVKPSTRKSPGG